VRREGGSESLDGDRDVVAPLAAHDPAQQRIEPRPILGLRCSDQADELPLVPGKPQATRMADAESPPRRTAEQVEQHPEGRQHLGAIRAAGIDELVRDNRADSPVKDDASQRPDEEMLAATQPPRIVVPRRPDLLSHRPVPPHRRDYCI
jgi:hypothetical protein